MNKQLFEALLSDKPPEGTHVFITDREILSENIMGCSIKEWRVAVLIKGADGYFKSSQELIDYISSIRFTGKYETDYIFIPCMSLKKDNQALKKGLSECGLRYREGWHLFYKKPYLDREQARDEVGRIIQEFINEYNVPRLEQRAAISSSELQTMDLPPINWIIEGLLPEGLAILSGPPKTYKSFMAIDLGLSISRGLPFLGFQTVKCGVLYYDLESTKRRPKDRIEKILQGQRAPDQFYIVTQEEKPGNLEEGFFDNMDFQLKTYPGIKLIIIDVYQKIRGPSKRGESFYERDYADGVKLQSYAMKNHICIMLLHHNSKKEFQGDDFNSMSGSTGLLGSVDTGLVITKEKRFDKAAKLSITGREIRPQELVVEFNNLSFRWALVGTVEEVAESKLNEEYKVSPIAGAIKKLVETNDGEWSGSASDLIKASKYLKGCEIYDKPQRVGAEISKFEDYLFIDGISYDFARNKNGRTYNFSRNGLKSLENSDEKVKK